MILKDKKNIGIVHLNEKDIMRHPIVKEVIDSYNKTDNQKKK